MLGTIYQQGIGADTAELKNEEGNDETGAHVEQMYNSDGDFPFIFLNFFSIHIPFIFYSIPVTFWISSDFFVWTDSRSVTIERLEKDNKKFVKLDLAWESELIYY